MPTPTHPPDAAVLEAGGSRVVVAPDGRLTSLCLGGREWLSAAGWAEHLSGAGAGAPATGAPATGAPDAAVTRWTAGPLTLERALTVLPDGALRAAYTLSTQAVAPTPVAWSARPLLALVPDTRLDLPVAARVRVHRERGVALGGPGAEHRWPVLRVGARDATPFGPREVDFTFPALAWQRFGGDGAADYACALVLDLPRAAGAGATPMRLCVEQDGARLELAADPGEVPHVTLWIDRAAGTLALAPTLGTGDPTAGGATIAPGATRRWTLTWRGRAAPASA